MDDVKLNRRQILQYATGGTLGLAGLSELASGAEKHSQQPHFVKKPQNANPESKSGGEPIGSGVCAKLNGKCMPEYLPPIQGAVRGPKFHWFGSYDKLQSAPTGRYVLGMEVDLEKQSAKPDDVIKIGMVELRNGDRWVSIHLPASLVG